MKFFPGFIAGVALGSFATSKMTPNQRRDLAHFAKRTATKVRSTHVADAIVEGASDIAGAAGERVSSVVSAGAGAVASVASPESGEATAPA